VNRRDILQGAFVALVASTAGANDTAPVEAFFDQAVERAERVLVFDVNETMLDIGALAPHFVRVFGDARVVHEWFSTVLLYSQVTTITGPYADFGAVARASLEMTAASRGVPLAAADRDAILTGLRTLPVHPDVRAGLEQLQKAGFRMVTLTNSAPAAVEQQLTNAGIAAFFERRLSVDSVKRFKPAPEVYNLVATELNVPVAQLRLIAAHAWDIVGAMRAGYAAAFVARPGKALYPLAPKPDIVEPDLLKIAARIIAIDRPTAR
jgi:2-haloacid dehalogenase